MTQPGDIGFTKIRGLVGILVSFGQWLNGDASRYTHCYVVLNDFEAVEARPWRSGYVLYKECYPDAAYSHIELTDAQRSAIVDEAKKLVGRRYGFSDYVALSLARLGIRPQWLTNYVTDKGHMICSQLADEAYRLAAVHLFNDGRLSQDVTPGDLLYVGRVW